jgi:hypothetical protein
MDRPLLIFLIRSSRKRQVVTKIPIFLQVEPKGPRENSRARTRMKRNLGRRTDEVQLPERKDTFWQQYVVGFSLNKLGYGTIGSGKLKVKNWSRTHQQRTGLCRSRPSRTVKNWSRIGHERTNREQGSVAVVRQGRSRKKNCNNETSATTTTTKAQQQRRQQ